MILVYHKYPLGKLDKGMGVHMLSVEIYNGSFLCQGEDVKKWLIIFITLSFLISLGIIFYAKTTDLPRSVMQAAIIGGSDPPLNEPVEEFYQRITKKPFGIFITPQTSPVHQDRFAGYHTGVDIEYEGVTREIPIRAIADGKVVLSKIASGYGGVIVLRHGINNKELFVLYGHLDPKSMLPYRTEVQKGQIIGVLGEGKTEETDGVRKHLHFAVLKKNSLDIRGYVQTKEELEAWYDPVEFLNSISQ